MSVRGKNRRVKVNKVKGGELMGHLEGEFVWVI